MLGVGYVFVCQQRDGEKATAKIEIPRRAFDAMIDWYNGVKREVASDE
jgi:hypothetical protein